MSVILALDYGEKRIGMAVSDPMGILANAIDFIKRTSLKRDLDALEQIVRDRKVDRVVIGLPLNMNGTEGPMAEAVRKFAEKVTERGMEVELWDERLSTRAAEAALLDADLSRKKRKGLRDKVAAAWFLQSYLDSQSNKR